MPNFLFRNPYSFIQSLLSAPYTNRLTQAFACLMRLWLWFDSNHQTGFKLSNRFESKYLIDLYLVTVVMSANTMSATRRMLPLCTCLRCYRIIAQNRKKLRNGFYFNFFSKHWHVVIYFFSVNSAFAGCRKYWLVLCEVRHKNESLNIYFCMHCKDITIFRLHKHCTLQ